MPRDDLSIDFVHKMTPSSAVEAQDPGLILDDWIHRTSNLHEEMRFLQDEIHDKDRAYNERIRAIDDADSKIQKFIRANGSHATNAREDSLRASIRDNYARAEKLADEKLALSQRLQNLLDKNLKHLDLQIKQLYDRAEPGFTDPDELPSIVRPSAANQSVPSSRLGSTGSSQILKINTAAISGARITNPQIRSAQAQNHGASSAPTTPAASIILSRKDRESSAGPASGPPKRGPRTSIGLINTSALARHSSLGPGTPKPGTPGSTARAGSIGPRNKSGSGGRRSTPSTSTRKKPPNTTKSGLNRVKSASRSNKASPTSTVDSELSEAESAASSRAASRAGSHTPAPQPLGGQSVNVKRGNKPGSGASRNRHRAERVKDADGDEEMRGSGVGEEEDDDDDEDDEGRKYCLCQHISYGDMVGCDNAGCPYEWFHWSCVGLKKEPEGRWFCPECTKRLGMEAR